MPYQLPTPPSTVGGVLDLFGDDELANGVSANIRQLIAAIVNGPLSGGKKLEGMVSPSYSGVVNTTNINAALALGGNFSITTPGTYIFSCTTVKTTSDGNTYNVAIIIPSNTRLYIGQGVILKLADGQTNPVLIQNSDIVNGNINVEIYGGIWDGNRNNSTNSWADNGGTGAWCAITMWMQNIVNLHMHDLTQQDPLGWGIGISKCSGFVIENINRIDSQANRAASSNQDGVDLIGQNSNGVLRNIYGNPMDDLVALLADQGAIHTNGLVNCMGGYGAINNISIENVTSRLSDGAWHLLRMMDSTTNPIQNVHLHNVSGPYIDAGMILGSDSSANTSALERIVFDGTNVYQLNTTAASAAIKISGSAGSLTFNNNRRTTGFSETVAGHIQVVTVNSVPSIRSLVVDNMEIRDNSPAGNSWVNIANGTVESLIVSNARLVTGLATGVGIGNLVNVAAGATVNRLQVSNAWAKQAKRLLGLDGTVNVCVMSNSVIFGQTATPQDGVVRIRGTVPLLKLIGCNLDMGSAGYTGGAINFTGSTGTTLVQMWGTTINNPAQPSIGRSAAETIRVQSLDQPVPSSILTPSRGDMIMDSGASNDPFRWNGTVWTAM